MHAHELGYAKVNYYNLAECCEAEADMYFRYLPRVGDLVTIFTNDDREIKGRVRSVEHFAEDERRIEPDITITLERV